MQMYRVIISASDSSGLLNSKKKERQKYTRVASKKYRERLERNVKAAVPSGTECPLKNIEENTERSH